jgi:hypothetical protein
VEAVLQAKKESNHRRYLRRHDQLRLEKQALSESVQSVTGAQRHQMAATDEGMVSHGRVRGLQVWDLKKSVYLLVLF